MAWKKPLQQKKRERAENKKDEKIKGSITPEMPAKSGPDET